MNWTFETPYLLLFQPFISAIMYANRVTVFYPACQTSLHLFHTSMHRGKQLFFLDKQFHSAGAVCASHLSFVSSKSRNGRLFSRKEAGGILLARSLTFTKNVMEISLSAVFTQSAPNCLTRNGTWNGRWYRIRPHLHLSRLCIMLTNARCGA